MAYSANPVTDRPLSMEPFRKQCLVNLVKLCLQSSWDEYMALFLAFYLFPAFEVRKGVYCRYLGHQTPQGKPCWCLPRISNETNSPRLALLYRQNFEREYDHCSTMYWIWRNMLYALPVTDDTFSIWNCSLKSKSWAMKFWLCVSWVKSTRIYGVVKLSGATVWCLVGVTFPIVHK